MMVKEMQELYWRYEIENKKYRFWKDRHKRKLRKLLEKRYEEKDIIDFQLDKKIIWQIEICKLSGGLF